jgi:hypothetical protein
MGPYVIAVFKTKHERQVSPNIREYIYIHTLLNKKW